LTSFSISFTSLSFWCFRACVFFVAGVLTCIRFPFYSASYIFTTSTRLMLPACSFWFTLLNYRRKGHCANSRPLNGTESRFLTIKFTYHFLVKYLRNMAYSLIADVLSRTLSWCSVDDYS
jgi:uncharacterized membrane protein YbhN (UPF0104 family)